LNRGELPRSRRAHRAARAAVERPFPDISARVQDLAEDE
jgi:hypothetical protein